MNGRRTKDAHRRAGARSLAARVNRGYASFQLAKALTTLREHEDPAARARAEERVARWRRILLEIDRGAIDYGSRAPVPDAPAWATLEVVTGGFATGALLAGGPLREHERELLSSFPEVPERDERRFLNAYFLTEDGLAELQEWLTSGRYEVDVPEEGALLAVAWLAGHGHEGEAQALVDEIFPYLDRLRFYPRPVDRPRRFGARVHVQDVVETRASLRAIQPNRRVLAQKEAVEVWAPFQDRLVALFLETVENGWPCQRYPPDWSIRALALLGEFEQLRKEHGLCGKPVRRGGHLAQLRELLGKAATRPQALTGREVGRVRMILERFQEKRGVPGSPMHEVARGRQREDVRQPTYYAIAQVVLERLDDYPPGAGIENLDPVTGSVDAEEAAEMGVPAGTGIPPSIRRKLERCLHETVAVLVERGIITSADILARVLPQMTSGIRSASISDPALRSLHGAVYRAFRRRRSLLLLDLQTQVGVEELPWFAAIERLRNDRSSVRERSRQALEEVTVLAITSFPYAILPNKLVRELRMLAQSAGLDIPFVEEVAADIFMGAFSPKFAEAARRAGDLIEGSLYSTYYEIDYAAFRSLPESVVLTTTVGFSSRSRQTVDPFAHHCARRAGVRLGSWRPATNGMIIEQEQIVTTHNLATLFLALDLVTLLRPRLGELAKTCFEWICRRQQMLFPTPHSELIMIKNTAYAWRQMIFFLALLSEDEVAAFLDWAKVHLDEQSEAFRDRFGPALEGLRRAATGREPERDRLWSVKSPARRFLGWSDDRHWLASGTRQ